MTAPSPILEMTGVTRTFHDSRGPVEVLRGVNLAITPGEFIMVTGPSGSGKTTLLNIAAMLDRAGSGSSIFCGRDTSAMSDSELCEARASRIGMVFQKFHLLQSRTARENVLFRWRYVLPDDGDRLKAADEALERVGLGEILHRPARLLSAGEMQRVAIARAIALPPTLLVADEPTGNLDSSSAIAVMKCFQSLNAGGITILMVTHNEHLLEYGTRHLVCRAGVLSTPGGSEP